MSAPTSLTDYRRAGYGAVAVETADEAATLAGLITALGDGVPVWRITATPGLYDARTGRAVDAKLSFAGAWDRVTVQHGAVLVVHDWHHIVKQPAAYRPLLEALPKLRQGGCTCYLLAPSWSLPPELMHEIPTHREALPGADVLRFALDTVTDAAGLTVADAVALVDAARGLCGQEAESAFALAAVRGELTPSAVAQRKASIIRQTPGLEVWDAVPESAVGGLSPLRNWLRDEVSPARLDAELRVRGLLAVGPPGTGKSLISRVAASILRVPLVRLDIGAVMGSLVGQSEERVRGALAVVDAVAPCVLWIDEIDSALGGAASSDRTDGGTLGRVLSTLLTWLQETSADVTVIATANSPERIPAALTRPGRLDAIWSIDLPSLPERAEIATVHLTRLGCAACEDCAAELARVTEGFSGAELASAVLAAARRTQRNVDAAALLAAAGNIVPLSRSRAADLDRMREWAQAHARQANTSAEAAPVQAQGRKLRPGGNSAAPTPVLLGAGINA